MAQERQPGITLERVQVCHQVLHLLLGQVRARHHAASLDNGLDYVLVRSSKATGQIRPAVHSFESRTFVAARRVRGMAAQAVGVINTPSLGLLRVQSEFGVGHFGLVFSAAEKKDGDRNKNSTGDNRRFSVQVTIMSLTQPF